ncbi:dnaJ homolog subfamily C member 27-like [Actinia tenebrosa]|uniref:DnaJ homolog subfamily C member 27-like n=1 Tax=Actinia tenebrosa TaxID=6105 RepID=A0A6P8ILF2_ACTTE|nr:dnaJ homolog subfamily C member 27-like [Actinia tenebrosa]
MDKKRSRKSIRIKIISMGNAETGKSCLIKRYCEKRFVSKYMTTIGIDYGVTKVVVNDKDIKVNIFDMAGHPVFYEVRNEFYKDTQGALLVYDVTNRESFESLEIWLDEIKKEIGDPSEVNRIVFVVCANKVDSRNREVDEAEGRLWADAHGFFYFETSAQTGEGTSEMFQTLFSGVVKALENGGRPVKLDMTTNLGYTKEQAEAIQRLRNAKGDYERLGIPVGASRDEINRAYKKLAVLLHPDKSVAPGTEEAFKELVAARASLLQKHRYSS